MQTIKKNGTKKLTKFAEELLPRRVLVVFRRAAGFVAALRRVVVVFLAAIMKISSIVFQLLQNFVRKARNSSRAERYNQIIFL